MSLYESARNAENRIELGEVAREGVAFGTPSTIAALLDLIRALSGETDEPVTLALDGGYGIDWPAIVEHLRSAAERAGIRLVDASVSRVFKTASDIARYKQAFITDDPSFGYVNDDGDIQDIVDQAKLDDLRRRIQQQSLADGEPAVVVVYGPGAAVESMVDLYDAIVYVEKTRTGLLRDMWSGRIIPFGADVPDPSYSWKEYYYCDYHLLDNHKRYVLERMDCYVSAADPENLVLLPRVSYDEIVSTLVRYPVKEVRIFQPGPWGAYRYRDLWDVPGLGCSAWHTMVDPILSVIVDIGRERTLTLPGVNLMQHAEQFVGPYIDQTYPRLWPLCVGLDDGYFPDPNTPAERTSMPMHNHPDTAYVNRHFNEPLGRCETYYIAEAYEGANTWLGYRDDANLEAWERACRESEQTGEPFPDWHEYVARWDTAGGDLFLIPPGTVHGHGGHQAVLEMDTVPSIAGTEYSFFLYDFMRPTWDDDAKAMTARPMKMHLEHGFDNEKWRRKTWVGANLRARPVVMEWTREFCKERYTTLPTMPFHIERFHFAERCPNDTEERFMHVVTLTVGSRMTIRSLDNPRISAEVEQFQSTIIPACFGRYEFINGDGGRCTVVQVRWKQG